MTFPILQITWHFNHKTAPHPQSGIVGLTLAVNLADCGQPRGLRSTSGSGMLGAWARGCLGLGDASGLGLGDASGLGPGDASGLGLGEELTI